MATESFFEELKEAYKYNDENIRSLARDPNYLRMVQYVYGNRCKELPDHKKHNKKGIFQKAVDSAITELSQLVLKRSNTPVTTDSDSQTRLISDNDE